MKKITIKDILNINNNKVCQLATLLKENIALVQEYDIVGSELKRVDSDMYLLILFSHGDNLLRLPIKLSCGDDIIKNINIEVSSLQAVGVLDYNALVTVLNSVFNEITFSCHSEVRAFKPKEFIMNNLTKDNEVALEFLLYGVAHYISNNAEVKVNISTFYTDVKSSNDRNSVSVHSGLLISDAFSDVRLRVLMAVDNLVLPVFNISQEHVLDSRDLAIINRIQLEVISLLDDLLGQNIYHLNE